jgi:alkylation response protein AidB-like acyl-CoA dehydrogenase
VTIPEEYGGMGLDLTTYVMIVEELSRGWISISGVDQHPLHRLLPAHEVRHRRAEGRSTCRDGDRRDPRRVLAVASPSSARTSQAIKTSRQEARRRHYEINGQKMWVTNGLRSGLVFVLVKTDPNAETRHKGFTCFIAEKERASREHRRVRRPVVPPQIKKMGYKGVESTELVFDGYKCPAENILGGEEAGLNTGFAQMMDALEVGRANVAAAWRRARPARARARRRYAQERKAFGKPIASTRRSSSSSPTWRRRSRRRAC